MHRPTVGLIAVALFAGAAILYLIGGNDSDHQAFAGAFVRVGAIMAVLWLALPAAQRMRNPWLLGVWIVGAIVLVMRPKLFPWVLLVGVVLYFLRPRRRPRPRD